MKILVATNATSGDRCGDFAFCAEGELVTIGDPCDSDLRDPDGGCG